MFEYDHSLLSLVALQQKGIRSTRVLEEVIEGRSFADEIYFDDLGYSVIVFTGFSRRSQAIKVASRLKAGKLILLDAGIPTVEEIIDNFCRYTNT